MSKSIQCGCGFVVAGDSDAEVLANAERHVEAEHANALSVLASTALGQLRNQLLELDRRLRALEDQDEPSTIKE